MITHFEKCVDLCNLTPKGSNLRCSRPLCSSQSTGGTPPGQRPRRVRLLTEKGPEEKSTTHRSEPCSGPSGPNSVPMRVMPAQTFPTPEGAYWVHTITLRINVNVPPMSAIEEHSSSYDLAVLLRCIQTALLCSLERR
jgi:hypothetical protein